MGFGDMAPGRSFRPKVETMELGASPFGIRKIGDSVEITDLHSKEPALHLRGWVGEEVFKMLSIQHDFDEHASEFHSREREGEYWYTRSKLTDNQDTSPAAKLAREIFNNFCHRTAHELVPDAYEKSGKIEKRYLDVDEFKRSLHGAQFPAVVKIFSKEEGRYPQDLHTFVILGRNEVYPDQIICFEKMGYRLPYRVTIVETIWRFWLRATDNAEGKLLVSAAGSEGEGSKDSGFNSVVS